MNKKELYEKLLQGYDFSFESIVNDLLLILKKTAHIAYIKDNIKVEGFDFVRCAHCCKWSKRVIFSVECNRIIKYKMCMICKTFY